MTLIAVGSLKEGMVLAQDVFSREDSATPILRTGAVLDGKTITRLQGQGIHKVFIQGGALFGGAGPAGTGAAGAQSAPVPAPPPAEQARPAARPQPATPAGETRTSISPVSTKMKTEAVSSLEKVFAAAASGDTDIQAATALVGKLDGIVEQLVGSMQLEPNALINIYDLKSFDDHTYHHCISVAVLSVSIGQQLGLPPAQLRQLGLCAIMHDIGKTSVPIEIIQKPGSLSPMEFEAVKNHSSYGTSYLMQSAIGDETLWRAVLFHHEKVDGTGYPKGLKGDSIPLWSRIIAVADVYDALTSTRPQRKPMQPAEALEYIMGGCGSSFDYDIVYALTQKIDLYPVGSIVELSTGEKAIVAGGTMPLRPVVELLASGELVDLSTDRQYLNVVIARLVPENEIWAPPGR